MTDTIKIPRPKFIRSKSGKGGRVEHDSRGNAVWTRSRATDSTGLQPNLTLAIVGDARRNYSNAK